MLDINLKQLEVFVTTAEYGSFTRAADVLYLSQSTVSSHIRSLEETLGVLLFDRAARRRVALTEAGKRIYPTAREIVDRCRALQSNLPEREGNLLTVGASTVPAQYLIPRLLADFSRQRPDCQFLLRRGDSAGIHELLRSGQIAVGFVGMRMDEKAFRYVPLLEDHLVLVTENSPCFQDLPAEAGLELLLREPGHCPGTPAHSGPDGKPGRHPPGSRPRHGGFGAFFAGGGGGRGGRPPADL